MRAILMILFLAGAYNFSNAATFSHSPVTEDATTECTEDDRFRWEVRISIRTGRQRRNCTGFGICRVAVMHRVEVKSPIADLSLFHGIAYGNGQLVERILFKYESISIESEKKYFSNGVFVLEEDFEASLKLGDKRETVYMKLRAGKYKVTRSELGFLLEVTG